MEKSINSFKSGAAMNFDLQVILVCDFPWNTIQVIYMSNQGSRYSIAWWQGANKMYIMKSMFVYVYIYKHS